MLSKAIPGARGALALCLGLGLMVMAMGGCAGNNEVKYTETATPKTDRDFTEFEFVQDPPTVAVPADLRASLDDDVRNYYQTQVAHLQEIEKQGQAMGQLNIRFRKMTVHYQVVKYDPGTPLLRRFLGGLGIGVAHMEVNSRYLDENGQEVSANRISAALGDEPHVLQSDTEIFAAMFVQTCGDYIRDKHYLLEPKVHHS